MLKQDVGPSGSRGWIINMASVAGLVGISGARMSYFANFWGKDETDGCDVASYAASKGAVVNLTRQIGVDYGKDKIHCNAICPGCKSLTCLSPLPLLELEARADDGPE